MSLKSAFKVDAKKSNEGVWIDGPSNTDGTVAGFKLTRSSRVNTKYTKKLEAETRPIRRDIELKTLGNEAAEKIVLNVFLDSVLLDWRNVQPEDDGVNLSYSRANAEKLLSDPEWSDLYEWLQEKAKNAEEFRAAAREKEAKN